MGAKLNVIRVHKKVIEFLQGGHTFTRDDNKVYMHHPYYVNPLDMKNGEIEYDDEGYAKCSLLTRGQIPNTEAGYKVGGLKTQKYIIKKANGDPVDPSAWYFVLRIDKDPHAQIAAKQYAISVRKDNEQLSDELLKAVESFEQK